LSKKRWKLLINRSRQWPGKDSGDSFKRQRVTEQREPAGSTHDAIVHTRKKKGKPKVQNAVVWEETGRENQMQKMTNKKAQATSEKKKSGPKLTA